VVTGLVTSGAAGEAEVTESPTGCPLIRHAPLTTVVRGDPATVVAQIECPNGLIEKSSVHVKVTELGRPFPIAMKPVEPPGTYQATVPVSLLKGVARFWYYVEGVSMGAQRTQTHWYPVRIIDAHASSGAAGGLGSSPAAAAASEGGKGTLLWIAGGTVLVGGAAVAVSGSTGDDSSASGSGKSATTAVIEQPGSSGGGNDDTPRRRRIVDDGGGTGFDPGQTVTVSASGTASGGFSTLPQDQVIDGTSVVGFQTVTGIRCTLDFEAYSIPDQFQIIYEGAVLADSGDTSGGGQIQGTAGGTSPMVTIRVITASGGTAWDWSALLEISVQ